MTGTLFQSICLALGTIMVASTAFFNWRLGKKLLEAIARIHILAKDLQDKNTVRR